MCTEWGECWGGVAITADSKTNVSCWRYCKKCRPRASKPEQWTCPCVRDAEVTIKIIFERSSQKGGGGGRGFEKRVNRGPTLKFYCRPKALEKQHFGKSHFYCRSFFPRDAVTIILDNCPSSTVQGVGLERRKYPRIIVGENSCHFGAAYVRSLLRRGQASRDIQLNRHWERKRCSRLFQARKKSTKINFLGPETARWGGGLPREGAGVENFVPSLESLSSLGFEKRNLGCPGNFAGMSRTPGGVQKVCAKKVRAHFSFPIVGN